MFFQATDAEKNYHQMNINLLKCPDKKTYFNYDNTNSNIIYYLRYLY